MRTNAAIAALYCASAVLAAPFTELRRERRQARGRHTLPPQNVTNVVQADGTSSTAVQYSNNWAGAVLVGNGFTTVTGSVVVPTPKSPQGANERTQYAAAAWVGIDGDTCSSAILQTGIDFQVQGGQVSYAAWYEWYPDYSYNFDDFALNAGDTIQMTVTTQSTSGGVATLENLSSGQSVTHSFSSESAQLCQTNAEWIVEDFSEGNELVPMVDFTNVEFTGAAAVTGGETVDTTGAVIMDIRQNNRVYTSCEASGSEVSCSYK